MPIQAGARMTSATRHGDPVARHASLPPLAPSLRQERNAVSRLAARHSVLDADSVHGPAHWARVERHARELCAALNVNPRIPVLFALLHDSCRVDDGLDPDHGSRAAAWMRQLIAAGQLSMGAAESATLAHAMDMHSHGTQAGPLIEQICWDADRLDLGRVGITPDPQRLCTAPAKESWRIVRATAWANGHTLRKAEHPACGDGGRHALAQEVAPPTRAASGSPGRICAFMRGPWFASSPD